MEIEADRIILQFIKYEWSEKIFNSKSTLTKNGRSRLVNLFEKRRKKNEDLVDQLLDELFKMVKKYPL